MMPVNSKLLSVLSLAASLTFGQMGCKKDEAKPIQPVKSEQKFSTDTVTSMPEPVDTLVNDPCGCHFLQDTLYLLRSAVHIYDFDLKTSSAGLIYADNYQRLGGFSGNTYPLGTPSVPEVATIVLGQGVQPVREYFRPITARVESTFEKQALGNVLVCFSRKDGRPMAETMAAEQTTGSMRKTCAQTMAFRANAQITTDLNTLDGQSPFANKRTHSIDVDMSDCQQWLDGQKTWRRSCP